MFDRFTDRARRVMELANQEAQRFAHEFIGTEHILLGLVKEGSGVAANVLKNLGVDSRGVRTEVERLIKCGDDAVFRGKLRQMPRADKVIEYAIEEAHNLSHGYVGTEHLLLGLFRQQEGMAALVLRNLGVQLENVRAEVLKLTKGADERPTAWKVGAEGSKVPTGILKSYVGGANFVRLLDAIQKWIDEREAGIQQAMHMKDECTGNAEYERAVRYRDEANSLERQFDEALGQLAAYVESLSKGDSSARMFERFTDHARLAMALAPRMAQELNHDFVGSEHILLRPIKPGSGIGADVLKNLDVDIYKLRRELGRSAGEYRGTVTGKLEHTPGAKKVIQYAIEESRNLNHNYVGTEHLLLGLLREQDGGAALSLMNMGIDYKAAREEIIRLLGDGDRFSDETNRSKPPADGGPNDMPVGTLPDISRLVATLTRMPKAVQKIPRFLQTMELWVQRYAGEVDELMRLRDESLRRSDYGAAVELRDRARELMRRFNEALEQLTAYIESLEKRE